MSDEHAAPAGALASPPVAPPATGSDASTESAGAWPRARETWLERHAAVLVVLFAYIYVFPYFAGIKNPNENVRVWMTRAIVEHGELSLNSVEKEWGNVGDKAAFGGKVYAGKAPGISFLGVPVLWAQTKLWHLFGWPSPDKIAATKALRWFALVLPLIAFMVAFSRHVERRSGSRATRDILVLGLGLGTQFYPYAEQFAGHALAAALAFSSYLLLSTRPERASPLRLVLAGFVAGAAVCFEYQTFVVALILSAYGAYVHRRRVLWMFAGALVPALLLGWYHKVCFGSPLSFPYGHIQDQKFAKYHKTGFYGFGLPDPEAIFIGLFSNSFGLFAFSPFLAAGVVGGVLAYRRGPRREGVLTLVVFVAMVLFLAGMTYWRGGWSVGPRFVTVLAPFLAAGAADMLRHVSRRKRAVVGGFVGASIFMCGIAGALYPHFPETLDNPIFDIALPLIYEGRAPYNVGYLLGIRGPWGLIPLLVVVLAFIIWSVARGADEPGAPPASRKLRAKQVGIAALVTVAFITWCSLFARDLDPDEKHACDVVRGNFEP